MGEWWEALQQDELIAMAGMVSTEQSPTCSFHRFDVFDTVPFIPFQPIMLGKTQTS